MSETDLIERLKLEARIHAGEATTANSTLYEIYQLCSGATGEKGSWNGAEPVRDALVIRDATIAGLRAELEDAIGLAAARVAELKAERDRLERNRDMWKGQCERQAAAMTALHGLSPKAQGPKP